MGTHGLTHIRLAATDKDVLAGALRTASKLRLEKNTKSGEKNPALAKRVRAGKSPRKKR